LADLQRTVYPHKWSPVSGVVCLQVKLCDACLSALRTSYLSSTVLYKSTHLYA